DRLQLVRLRHAPRSDDAPADRLCGAAGRRRGALMLLPFFQWVESTRLHDAIANSSWAFAVIESVHLLALAVIGGAVLILDLRFLGLGLRRQSINEVAREAQPYLVGSLIVMLVTGVALFVSEPTKCYYSIPFWWKMTSLALAMLFTFTVRARVAR